MSLSRAPFLSDSSLVIRITRLELERVRLGLSQQTLGVITRIRQQDICLIELGRLVPTRPKLKRLAAVLAVPPDDLLKPVRVDSHEAALLKVAVLRRRVAALEREVARMAPRVASVELL